MNVNHRSRRVSADGGITGRDAYIMVKALGYAIASIAALPEDRQEESDCYDMRTLLHHFVPAAAARDHMAVAIGEALQMPVRL